MAGRIQSRKEIFKIISVGIATIFLVSANLLTKNIFCIWQRSLNFIDEKIDLALDLIVIENSSQQQFRILKTKQKTFLHSHHFATILQYHNT